MEEKSLGIFPKKNSFKNYFRQICERFGLFNLHQHITTYNWPESLLWQPLDYQKEKMFHTLTYSNKLGWAGWTAKVEEKKLTKLNLTIYNLKFPLTLPTTSSLELSPDPPWKVPNLKIHLSSILLSLLHSVHLHWGPLMWPAETNFSTVVSRKSNKVSLILSFSCPLSLGQPSWKCL